MRYECEHGKRVYPQPEGPDALEYCAACPLDRRQVKYMPIYEEGEETVEQKLGAALLHHYRFQGRAIRRPNDEEGEG